MQNKKLKTLITTILFILLLSASNLVFAQEKDKITSYNMNITFSEQDKSLKVDETVKFTNPYDTALKDLVFHLYPDSYSSFETMPSPVFRAEGKELPKEQIGDINIEKVLVNSKEVKFTQDNQILKFPLETPLKKNEEIEIKISFTLKIPQGYNRLGYNNDVYYISNWYPILSIYDVKTNKWDENPFYPVGESNYSDIANYDITLNTNKNVVIASTGVVISENVKDDIKTTKIKAENVRDFVFMMSEKFKVISKEVNDIKINSFYITSDNLEKGSKDNAIKMLDIAADSIDFFSKTFGKYPYPEFDIVETYLSGGAMEYPQLIQMPKYSHGPDDDTGYSRWEEEAVVHEAGHQWWYVCVGNNEFMEPFLDESLTVFSTALYYEKKDGKYSQNGVLMKIRSSMSMRYPNSSAPFNTSVDKYKDFHEYTETIYRKAPIVFEDLRSQVGEEKFTKIMQTYFNRYLYKNATIEGFLDVVGEVSGEAIKNNIKTAITSKDYNPINLEPTEEQRRLLNIEMLKDELKTREKKVGLTIGSFMLKVINGEDILIVQPSNLSKDENDNVNAFIKSIQENLEQEYKVKIKIKKDIDLTDYDKNNNNLLIIGNPENNKYLSEISSKLPIAITLKGIMTDDVILKGDKNSGIFVMKGPQSPDKLSLVIFWQNTSPVYYDFQWDNYSEFIIRTEKGIEIRGKF